MWPNTNRYCWNCCEGQLAEQDKKWKCHVCNNTLAIIPWSSARTTNDCLWDAHMQLLLCKYTQSPIAFAAALDPNDQMQVLVLRIMQKLSVRKFEGTY